MIFQEKVEMIEGSEIVFQIITLTNSFYIYVGDKRQNMNNLFLSIQTPYVDIIYFLIFQNLLDLQEKIPCSRKILDEENRSDDESIETISKTLCIIFSQTFY